MRTFTRPSLAGDAILGYCIRNQRDIRACVHMCQKFINKGEGRQRETLTFFPGGTRFWLVLRMCVRAFLMFFSFMLDSTAGGRNSERPHSFLWKEGVQSASSVRPYFQNGESFFLFCFFNLQSCKFKLKLTYIEEKHVGIPVFSPNLLDVLERDLLALPGCHGEDVHLQGGQSQRSVILQLRAEPFQDHIVTTL